MKATRFIEKPMAEVMELLKSKGYTFDFNLLEVDGAPKKITEINPSELSIEKIYRFYAKSDVDDESILYAMCHTPTGRRGVFVNGYGFTADVTADKILEQIAINEIDDSNWGLDTQGTNDNIFNQ